MSDAVSTITLKVDSSQARTELAALVASVSKLKSEFASFNTLSSEVGKQQAGLQSLKTQVADLNSTVSNLAATHAKSAARLNEHTSVVKKHSEAQAALHSALRGVAGGLDYLWLSYSKYAVVMAAAYGTVKTIRESLSQGSELNYSAQFAAALSDQTTDNASAIRLKNSILDQLPSVVKDIPYSTNEAAKALRDMAQAGVEVEQGLKLIPTAAKAAIMGETDLATAAKDIVATMEVFSLKSNDPLTFAKNFQRVGDVTASVASSTSASFTDVIQSFKSATGVANLYKVSLEEVAATVDVLGKAGIKGSQAGTFTRNFISNLYNAQSKGAKDVKDILGVSAFDGSGRMKDYVTVVNELFVALNKLNDEGLTLAFEKLFNERSTRPAGQLLDSFKELATRINELQGAGGTLDGFVAKLEGAAKIQWQDAMAKGSDLLSQAFRDAEKDVVALAGSFRDFVTDPTVISGLAELVKGVAALAKGASDFWKKVVDGGEEAKRKTAETYQAVAQRRAELASDSPYAAAADRMYWQSGAVKGYKGAGRSKVTDVGEYVPPFDPNQYQFSGRSTISGVGEYARAAERGTQSLKLPDKAAEAEARRLAREAAKIREDNLSSGLKQEHIQLAKELLDIEIQQASQEINSAEATRQKNAATTASIEIERQWIEASLADAKVAKDKVQIEKYQNDLVENSEKLKKQEQQTLLDTTKARVADRNAIQDTNLASERYVEDLQFEIEAVRKTAVEVENLRIERERARTEQDLWNKLSRSQITPDQFAAESSANDVKAAAAKAAKDEQRTFQYGWDKAFQEYADNATNAASLAKEAFDSTTSAMTDMLTEFATTGKLTMKDMATSILKSLATIAARQAAMGLLSLAMMAYSGASSASTSTSTTPGYGGSGLGNGITLKSAHGNVFNSASLSSYSNGVYNSPRYFAFANGGVFAEAGPEAIMPLTRTASGDLGVRSVGGGSGANISVTNNVTVNSDGKSETSSQVTGAQGAALARMIEASTIQIITRELRPGGLLYGH